MTQNKTHKEHKEIKTFSTHWPQRLCREPLSYVKLLLSTALGSLGGEKQSQKTLSPFFLKFNSEFILCWAESSWNLRDTEDSIPEAGGRSLGMPRCGHLHPARDTPVRALGSPPAAPNQGSPLQSPLQEQGPRVRQHCHLVAEVVPTEPEAGGWFPISRAETQIGRDFERFGDFNQDPLLLSARKPLYKARWLSRTKFFVGKQQKPQRGWA